MLIAVQCNIMSTAEMFAVMGALTCCQRSERSISHSHGDEAHEYISMQACVGEAQIKKCTKNGE